jgi:hypothetical protein
MYDGYKIFNLPVPVNKLLENPHLHFPGHFNRDTGEVLNRSLYCKHKGQEFIIKNGTCKLKGSIHKYFNTGIHNWNDFKYSDVLQALENMWKEYEINPKRACLNKTEVGVNIVVPFSPELFFMTLISYQGTQFTPFEIEGSIGMWCKKEHYYIKIYDKSHQYPEAPGYTLRFELSSRKMDFFKGRIQTFSDYLNYDTFLFYGERLQQYFDEILTCDYKAGLKILNRKEKSMLDQGTNCKFWENLNPDSKNFPFGNNDIDYKRARKRYGKTLNLFKNLVKKYNLDEMQVFISNSIKDKLLILNDYTPEIRDKVTFFLDQFATYKGGQSDLLHIRSPYPLHSEELMNEYFHGEDEPAGNPSGRYCKTCGRDISNQKDGSLFCSETLYGKEGKKCRNTESNFKHKLELCEQRGIAFLFDPFQLIEMNQRKQQGQYH